jgi:hypothetical protein
LPPDRAEELFSIVGFGADDTVSEILSAEEEQG